MVNILKRLEKQISLEILIYHVGSCKGYNTQDNILIFYDKYLILG